MTINITEAQVSGFRPLKHGISLSLNIKDEDLNRVDRDFLEELWKSGDSIVAVLQRFQQEKPKKENKKGYLALLMQKYAEKNGSTEEEEKKRLYKKYNISSRSELTDEEVDYEIESYKAGLNFDN